MYRYLIICLLFMVVACGKEDIEPDDDWVVNVNFDADIFANLSPDYNWNFRIYLFDQSTGRLLHVQAVNDFNNLSSTIATLKFQRVYGKVNLYVLSNHANFSYTLGAHSEATFLSHILDYGKVVSNKLHRFHPMIMGMTTLDLTDRQSTYTAKVSMEHIGAEVKINYYFYREGKKIIPDSKERQRFKSIIFTAPNSYLTHRSKDYMTDQINNGANLVLYDYSMDVDTTQNDVFTTSQLIYENNRGVKDGNTTITDMFNNRPEHATYIQVGFAIDLAGKYVNFCIGGSGDGSVDLGNYNVTRGNRYEYNVHIHLDKVDLTRCDSSIPKINALEVERVTTP